MVKIIFEIFNLLVVRKKAIKIGKYNVLFESPLNEKKFIYCGLI